MNLDLPLFFTALAAWVTNAMGVNDHVRDAFRAALATGRDVSLPIEIWVRTRMAKPISTYIFAMCGVLFGLIALTCAVHGYGLTPLERDAGILWQLLAFGTAAIAGALAWGYFMRFWGRERYVLDNEGNPLEEVIGEGDRAIRIRVPHANYCPKRVVFFASVTIMIAAALVVALLIGMHAVLTENRGILALAMAAFAVVGTTLLFSVIIVAWILQKGTTVAEVITQIVAENAAAIAPGVTLKNASERFLVNFFEQSRVAQMARHWVKLFLVAVYYMTLLMYIAGPGLITAYWSYGSGLAVIIARLLTLPFSRISAAAEERTEDAIDFLHKHALKATLTMLAFPYVWAAAMAIPAVAKFVDAVKYFASSMLNAIGGLLNGHKRIAEGWHWLAAFASFLFLGIPIGIATLGLMHGSESRWRHMIRVIGIGIPIYFFAALSTSSCDSRSKGIALVESDNESDSNVATANPAPKQDSPETKTPPKTKEEERSDAPPRKETPAPKPEAKPRRPAPPPTTVASQPTPREESLAELKAELEDF